MKIQFVKSPTGAFNLAYDAGMIATVPDDIAKRLIDEGYATEIKTAKKARTTKAKAAEKRAKV